MPQAATSDGVRARVNAMSVTTMRSIIDQVGWSHAHIVEKPELRALVGEALTQSECEIDDSTPAVPRRPGNEHAALLSGSSSDARPLSATADDQTPMGLLSHERERSGCDRLPSLSRLRHRSCSLRLAATFAFCIALSAFILAFLELPLLSFEPHPTAKAFSDISRNAAAWERKYADVLTQMGLDVKF